MKKVLVFVLIMLYTGCSVSERKKEDCVEWVSWSTVSEECVGGRGVAPVICIPKEKVSLHCVRWLPSEPVDVLVQTDGTTSQTSTLSKK
jgi:hypothetical protein